MHFYTINLIAWGVTLRVCGVPPAILRAWGL